MSYEINATFIVITNNYALVKYDQHRKDSHYTVKAVLGSHADLSVSQPERLNQNSMTTLLIPKKTYDKHASNLKSGREIAIRGTLMMHSRTFHPVYVKEIASA
ncbi:MAG: hypothetical protein CMF43_00140 [Legionellales bacterium]|jgi:hypothetical protein|nr:hypothetical protein [Legionellales bacterium]|tara:strand:+ start:324 stop:632 length:309 start_codon:yes stop_codon:yes gene_type:complete